MSRSSRRRYDGPTDAEIDRSQAMIGAILGEPPEDDPITLDPPRHYLIECDSASQARVPYMREHILRSDAWELARQLSRQHSGFTYVITIAEPSGDRIGHASFHKGRQFDTEGDHR